MVSELFTVADNNSALAVGHSYFLPSGDAGTEAESLSSVARRFAYEVVPLLNEYAAEGLVDAAKFSSTLNEVGIDGGLNKQDAIEEAVLAWLNAAATASDPHSSDND